MVELLAYIIKGVINEHFFLKKKSLIAFLLVVNYSYCAFSYSLLYSETLTLEASSENEEGTIYDIKQVHVATT